MAIALFKALIVYGCYFHLAGFRESLDGLFAFLKALGLSCATGAILAAPIVLVWGLVRFVARRTDPVERAMRECENELVVAGTRADASVER
jgi:hypothetical protein